MKNYTSEELKVILEKHAKYRAGEEGGERANLQGANLQDAYLQGAYLQGAYLQGAYLQGAKLPRIPVIQDIRAKILERVLINPECLDMSQWHCGTTHCLAGHAVDLAGEAGYVLEDQLTTRTAAALIFSASGEEIPDFHSTNEAALAWLKAEKQEKTEEVGDDNAG